MHARLPLRHDLTDLEEAIVVEGVDFAVRGHRGRSSAGQRRPHGGRAAEGKSRSQHGEHFYRLDAQATDKMPSRSPFIPISSSFLIENARERAALRNRAKEVRGRMGPL